MPVTYTLEMPYSGDVSVNRYLQKTVKGGVFTRETAKIWGMCLRGMLNYLLPQWYDPADLDDEHPFDIELDVHFPRAFSKRSGDPTNFDKFPRDIIAAALGVDDAGTGGSQKGSYGHGELACIILTIILKTKVPGDNKSLWLA